MRRVNGTAGHARGPAGRMTAHQNKRALQWDTHTQDHSDSVNLETSEKLSYPHFSIMSAPTVRGAPCCSITMINNIDAPVPSLSASTSSPVCQMIKGFFYDPTFLFLYVLYDICCPGYFPDPSLNPTHPFNAVDKCRQTGFSSGTSRLSARCWKNTYPHSPASNSFSGIDVQQHTGQINLIQGKLPIVHAVKRDETWNTLTHNEQCVCLLCNLPPNFLSFSLPLVL